MKKEATWAAPLSGYYWDGGAALPESPPVWSAASELPKNGEGELSRLMNAAVVSPVFRELLLKSPATALAAGYGGESFCLASHERELVLAVEATSLADFALQLANGKGNGRCRG